MENTELILKAVNFAKQTPEKKGLYMISICVTQPSHYAKEKA